MFPTARGLAGWASRQTAVFGCEPIQGCNSIRPTVAVSVNYDKARSAELDTRHSGWVDFPPRFDLLAISGRSLLPVLYEWFLLPFAALVVPKNQSWEYGDASGSKTESDHQIRGRNFAAGGWRRVHDTLSAGKAPLLLGVHRMTSCV
jgi:hypothetical protein